MAAEACRRVTGGHLPSGRFLQVTRSHIPGSHRQTERMDIGVVTHAALKPCAIMLEDISLPRRALPESPRHRRRDGLASIGNAVAPFPDRVAIFAVPKRERPVCA